MSPETQFDPLEEFARIERLVAKVYFRFSHLFLNQPKLRDFWWQMAEDEEQHASILLACKEFVKNYPDERIDPSISRERAEKLKEQIQRYLSKGTPSISVDEAFQMALEIESSELDAIYSKLLRLGGPKVAKTLENLGVPASVQRQRLKAALKETSKNPQLRKAAEEL